MYCEDINLYFQQIKSIKKININQFRDERDLMFFNFSLSRKEYLRIHGCLASAKYSDYARTLHHI